MTSRSHWVEVSSSGAFRANPSWSCTRKSSIEVTSSAIEQQSLPHWTSEEASVSLEIADQGVLPDWASEEVISK